MDIYTIYNQNIGMFSFNSRPERCRIIYEEAAMSFDRDPAKSHRILFEEAADLYMKKLPQKSFKTVWNIRT
jgi:hypothetical protein